LEFGNDIVLDFNFFDGLVVPGMRLWSINTVLLLFLFKKIDSFLEFFSLDLIATDLVLKLFLLVQHIINLFLFHEFLLLFDLDFLAIAISFTPHFIKCFFCIIDYLFLLIKRSLWMFLKAHKKITLLLKAFTLCDCFIELFLDYSGFFDLFANFLCKLLLGLDLFLEFLILIINLLLNGRYLLSSSLKVLLMLFKFFSNHMSFLIHLLPFSFLLLELFLQLFIFLLVIHNLRVLLR